MPKSVHIRSSDANIVLHTACLSTVALYTIQKDHLKTCQFDGQVAAYCPLWLHSSVVIILKCHTTAGRHSKWGTITQYSTNKEKLFLDRLFPNQRTEHGGSMKWSQRSPNPMSMDFSWGLLRTMSMPLQCQKHQGNPRQG